ncbi:4-hydroxy-tetrahydrodipicolinate synthase [Marinicella meishanensis]|uniref:4-hydroxy-tetrahydrodipicolinate synthase n=1 Tax=Marinicella meishanensis TaxID=2873263 RepID=UPI001CBB5348|nr:4-hydroxy-tetrahydrodipicolinate synthase [Marinicella sp. NBU2979]
MGQIQAKDLTGSMVALVTPMHADGRINLEQWTQLIQWHISCGTQVLVVAGTTGESALLSAAEISQLIQQAAQLCHGTNTWVMAGTGAIDPAKVSAANRQAQADGAQAVLVVTPYYLTLTQRSLMHHFKQIADESPLPVVLYNVPSRTGNDLQAATTATLATHPNIIGIKEAKADMQRVEKLAKIKNFAVLSGDDGTFVQAMAHGADGVISVAANARPKAIKQMCDLMQLGQVAEAELKNAEMEPFYQWLFHEPNPCPVKAIMHEAGLMDDGIRAPLLLTHVSKSDLNKYLNPIRKEFSSL